VARPPGRHRRTARHGRVDESAPSAIESAVWMATCAVEWERSGMIANVRGVGGASKRTSPKSACRDLCAHGALCGHSEPRSGPTAQPESGTVKVTGRQLGKACGPRQHRPWPGLTSDRRIVGCDAAAQRCTKTLSSVLSSPSPRPNSCTSPEAPHVTPVPNGCRRSTNHGLAVECHARQATDGRRNSKKHSREKSHIPRAGLRIPLARDSERVDHEIASPVLWRALLATG
jgi:hypothetical protein